MKSLIAAINSVKDEQTPVWAHPALMGSSSGASAGRLTEGYLHPDLGSDT